MSDKNKDFLSKVYLILGTAVAAAALFAFMDNSLKSNTYSYTEGKVLENRVKTVESEQQELKKELKEFRELLRKNSLKLETILKIIENQNNNNKQGRTP